MGYARVTETVDVGVAGFVLPGQTESGDLEIVKPISDGMLIGIVDGLGHGQEAAIAAKEAIKIIGSSSNNSIVQLVKCCHEGLKTTRGVAMSLAALNTDNDTMTWLGIGNVEGILFRADPRSNPSYESLLLRPGVVGYVLPQLQTSVLTLIKGDLLVFISDGIKSDFAGSIPSVSNNTPRQIAERICSRQVKGTDDALVLVTRYKGHDS